jgi:hypothetical protein
VACDVGIVATCGKIGVLLARGDILVRDEVRAAGLLRRACDAGLREPCAVLNALSTGAGVPGEPLYAAKVSERECDAGDRRACISAGNLFSGKDDVRATAAFLQGLGGYGLRFSCTLSPRHRGAPTRATRLRRSGDRVGTRHLGFRPSACSSPPSVEVAAVPLAGRARALGVGCEQVAASNGRPLGRRRRGTSRRRCAPSPRLQGLPLSGANRALPVASGFPL